LHALDKVDGIFSIEKWIFSRCFHACIIFLSGE
jgi:hypothetical protein